MTILCQRHGTSKADGMKLGDNEWNEWCDELCSALETIEIMRDPDCSQMIADSAEDIRLGRLHDHEDIRRQLG